MGIKANLLSQAAEQRGLPATSSNLPIHRTLYPLPPVTTVHVYHETDQIRFGFRSAPASHEELTARSGKYTPILYRYGYLYLTYMPRSGRSSRHIGDPSWSRHYVAPRPRFEETMLPRKLKRTSRRQHGPLSDHASAYASG